MMALGLACLVIAEFNRNKKDVATKQQRFPKSSKK